MLVIAKRLKKAINLKSVLVPLLGSMLIAISAPFTIFLPFTFVPIALQMNVAFLVAYILGPKRGVFAVGLFLMQGVMGLPVFAGGTFGIVGLIGPTGGYILGYFMAAFLISSFNPKSEIDYFKMYSLANLTVYFFGFMWLATFIGPFKAFTLGILPFVFGDFLKILCICKLSKPLLARIGDSS